MKTDNKPLDDPLNFSSRELLLKANSEIISQIQARIRGKRFRVQEGDSIKLAYFRVLIQALTLQNTILRDAEIEDLQDRIKALEEAGTC
jgi:hypothetical protein